MHARNFQLLEIKCSKPLETQRCAVSGRTTQRYRGLNLKESHTYFWHLDRHSAVCIATWQPGSSLPIAAQHDQRAARVAVAGCHAPLWRRHL